MQCCVASLQYLHDRALYYYRLFQSGSDVASSVVSSASNLSNSSFADNDTNDVDLREFNRLGIIFGTSEEHFISEEYRLDWKPIIAPKKNQASAPTSSPALMPEVQQQVATGVVPEQSEKADYEDLLGFFQGSTSISTPESSANPPPPNFQKGFTLDGDTFQQIWESSPEGFSTLSPTSVIHTPASIESCLSPFNIYTMASGDLDAEIKIFLYANLDGAAYLLQLTIDKTCEPRVCGLVVKGGDSATANVVGTFVNNALGNVI